MSGQHDHASELRNEPDLWRVISNYLWVAADHASEAARYYALDFDDYTHSQMRDALEAKFRAGEAEHGRDWLNMTRADLTREIRAELMDLVLYHAMLLARWRDDPPVAQNAFWSNRDPGDEQDDVTGIPV